MTQKHFFIATIQNAGNGGAYVEIPFDVESVFGSKRPKVKAMIDGVSYRGTLVRMGTDCHLLLILKSIRERIGKAFGDEVEITLEEDTELRTVDVPADLMQALKSEPEAKTFFEKLAYTHQKEYVNWIEEAKKNETRQRRVTKTIEMLKQKNKSR